MPDNFRIEFYHLIIDSIIDDFSQRIDQESMQFFSFGLTIHKKSNYFYIGFIVAFEDRRRVNKILPRHKLISVGGLSYVAHSVRAELLLCAA